jgi:hypothetical protein
MGKGSAHEFSGLQRGAVLAVVTAMLAMLLTVIMPSIPAYADGCGSQSDFGCDSSNSNGGNNGTGGSGGQGSNPGSGGNTGGGGGGGPVDPFMRVDRVVPDPGNCPYRAADGKSALGVDFYWTTLFEYGTKDTPPNNSYYWKFPVYTPGYGYLWEAEVLVGKTCLYPPMTYLTTQTCYVSSTSTVSMTMPQSKVVGSKTATSGYSQGSTDYNACRNSNSQVSLGLAINEQGFYVAKAYSMAQTATVEVAYTPDGLTGQIPAPKIIGLSGVYQTAPKNATGSLDCVGWSSPGRIIGDWTETACSSQNSANPSYVCTADNMRYNGFDFGANAVVESMRDGSDNKLEFSQGISGSGITVHEKFTTFKRSADSGPWDASMSAKANLIQLDVLNAAGKREAKALQTSGLSTRSFDGQVNTAYLMGFTASDMIEKKDALGRTVWAPQTTDITQVLKWTGERTMQSVIITGHDTASGVMTTTATTVTVPTTGLCNQTASMYFIRAIGDSID